MLIQQLINGLLIGGVYAIIGVGFSLVYGVMGIINLAHGSLIMLGAYVTFQVFTSFGIDPFLGIIFSTLIMFLLGYLQQRYIINRVTRFGLPMTIVLTYGIDLVLINLALLIWSSDYRAVAPSYVGNGISLGNVVIPSVRLIIFVSSIIITGLLYLFLYRTRTGKAIRATALHREGAQLVGVDIEKIYAITFAVGSGLAGAGGSLLSMIFTITPFMGVPILSKAFAVAVLGGLGNITGAVLGGIVLGVAEAAGVALAGTQYQQMMGYLILLLVLIIRPQGLMGRRFFR